MLLYPNKKQKYEIFHDKDKICLSIFRRSKYVIAFYIHWTDFKGNVTRFSKDKAQTSIAWSQVDS